jgi:hypothetical protein
MLTRFEEAQLFIHRATEAEKRASQEQDAKLKETLHGLAQQYREIAEQSKNGPY